MAKDISPEERLLSLIKNKKRPAGDTAASAPAPSVASRKAPVESVISKADERISDMLKSDLFRNKLFEPSTLRNVNKYLIVILGIFILYFLADLIFIRPYKSVQALVSKPVSEQGQEVLSSKTNSPVAAKDYSSYAGALPGRTVFGPSQGGTTGPEETAITSGGVSDQLGLVGVVAGDNPQAIIEDKKAQKTYYLTKGQSIDGYAVEEIYEDRVVLNSEGKKISLSL